MESTTWYIMFICTTNYTTIISLSQGYRKLHGDLIYLYAVTLEEKRLHITACTRGFYVNQSTDEEFNPKPANPNHLCHSLIELLSQVSGSFKRNFTMLQRKRTQRHPFERVATPYQVTFLKSVLIMLQTLINWLNISRFILGLLPLLNIRLMLFERKMPSPPNWDTKNIFLDKLAIGTKNYKQRESFLGKIYQSVC